VSGPALLAATSNPHKLVELQRLLPEAKVVGFSAIDVIGSDPSLWDVPPATVVESGATFLENAVLKAVHASQRCALPVVADDSGLCVDHLAGAPGVHSARHGGPGLSDRQRYELVLEALRGVPRLSRGASYRAVIVLARHGRVLSIHEGAVSGSILESPRGSGGFGYDPIFLVTALQKAMAELTPAEKDAVSHRARATDMLRLSIRQGILEEA
jgi:XTP/dITP diphosphohydrolase